MVIRLNTVNTVFIQGTRMENTLIRPAENVIETNRNRNWRKSILRYPENLGSHAIVMNFREYDFASVRTGGNRAASKDSIVLPLPANLTDTYKVEVRAAELGTTGAIVTDVASGSITAGTVLSGLYSTGQKGAEAATAALSSVSAGNFGQGLDQMIKLATDSAAEIKYFTRSAIDSLFPAAGLALDTFTGTTVNPHVTLAFNGVDLKRHSFDWTFAPKSKEESDTVRKIINKLRYSSLPAYQSVGGQTSGSLSRGLLKYPSIVDIFFTGIDPEYYWYFKPCMIENITIDYTPGNLAILEGGKPALIKISLQLTETSIHTREDYQTEELPGANPLTLGSITTQALDLNPLVQDARNELGIGG